MNSAFGIDHGAISKMVVKVPVKAAPGPRGKLRRLKANAYLGAVNTGLKAAKTTDAMAAAVPRLHLR